MNIEQDQSCGNDKTSARLWLWWKPLCQTIHILIQEKVWKKDNYIETHILQNVITHSAQSAFMWSTCNQVFSGQSIELFQTHITNRTWTILYLLQTVKNWRLGNRLPLNADGLYRSTVPMLDLIMIVDQGQWVVRNVMKAWCINKVCTWLTVILTSVSLGPCNIDDASNADFPFTSTPLTASSSSPYEKFGYKLKNMNIF